MQSLGKISNYRCMPAPVQLQSIKSSSIDTSDGNVSLVPHGTSGWNSSNKDVKDDSKVTKTEKKEGRSCTHIILIIRLKLRVNKSIYFTCCGSNFVKF